MLKAVSGGNGPRILARSHVLATKTDADTTKTTLATIAIPAGAMGTDGALRVTAKWRFSGGAATKTVFTDFGGTTFQSYADTSAGVLTTQVTIANRNSASAQIGGLSGTDAMFGKSGVADYNTGTVNTANAQNLTLAAQWGTAGAGTNNIRLEGYTVELLP